MTTRADKIGAGVVTAAIIAASFGAGWATSRATTPEPATTTATSTASSPASRGPVWEPPTPTTEPSPVTPAVYGNVGLAAAVAKREGHPSMSAACAAGIAWTCDITEIKQEIGAGLQWKATVGDVPADGDAIAQELLDRAPADIKRVQLSYVPHGQTAFPQAVGSAERPWN